MTRMCCTATIGLRETKQKSVCWGIETIKNSMVSCGFLWIFPWMFPINPWISPVGFCRIHPQVVVGEIPLHESAMCSEKIGINCSCFSVEDGSNGAGCGVPKHPKTRKGTVFQLKCTRYKIYIYVCVYKWLVQSSINNIMKLLRLWNLRDAMFWTESWNCWHFLQIHRFTVPWPMIPPWRCLWAPVPHLTQFYSIAHSYSRLQGCEFLSSWS